ncbi:CCAAT-binding transcription factor (CBF-B/NF-YA) subunit B-domain-containing protein [Gaertneriomyces semiglobifer]|nr:CCAAT-binding transcription factor (CBF-B/NF-YA) subunit B-domain-containing protein [Gaertneriomyces semiglobifer]
MAVNAAAVAAAAAAMNSSTGDEPMYVNAKQYHRILKRREARARLEAANRGKKEKGYIHESRHRHAMRRPRGPGGRFLSAAELQALKDQEHHQRIGSPDTSVESPQPAPALGNGSFLSQTTPATQETMYQTNLPYYPIGGYNSGMYGTTAAQDILYQSPSVLVEHMAQQSSQNYSTTNLQQQLHTQNIQQMPMYQYHSQPDQQPAQLPQQQEQQGRPQQGTPGQSN